MKLEQVQRTQVKIKVGLQGPSGSGKTYSALLLAFGLTNDWSKIAVIDTENKSSALYSFLGDYSVINLQAPYNPERYIQAIEICEKKGIEVIIIDSISHEWQGSGGILDILPSMGTNSFTSWNKLTPRHNAFVEKILQSNAHIICAIRAKQSYVLTERNGKVIPEKIGLKGITREGMDYEFTLVFALDMKHQAIASKDRTGLFNSSSSRVISPEIGKMLIQWCNELDQAEYIIPRILACQTIAELKELYKQYPDYQDRLIDHFSERKDQLEKLKVTGNG